MRLVLLATLCVNLLACGDSTTSGDALAPDVPDTNDAGDSADGVEADTADTQIADTTSDSSISEILDDADISISETSDLADATAPDADSAADTAADTNADVAPPIDATPVEAPAGVWTWVDQPGAVCHDGSTTGFAVSRSPSGRSETLVYFHGGGACWDMLTCYVLNTAAKGPFGKAQWDAIAGNMVGIFDRDDELNPFADWNLVFIPYCTGDLHGGDRVATFTAGVETRTWHFKGANNSALVLPRLAVTFPRPEKLVITGASAGGYGATLNYHRARALFRPTESALLDDSGPFLRAEGIRSELRTAWFAEWNLQPILDEVGCADCSADLSRIYPRLGALHPDDRMGLICSLQDQVISAYFGLAPLVFEAGLESLALNVLANTTTWRWFFFGGQTHTTLANPGAFSVGGVELWDWLRGMVDGSPWSSYAP